VDTAAALRFIYISATIFLLAAEAWGKGSAKERSAGKSNAQSNIPCRDINQIGFQLNGMRDCFSETDPVEFLPLDRGNPNQSLSTVYSTMIRWNTKFSVDSI
jgi:hypothetical protein